MSREGATPPARRAPRSCRRAFWPVFDGRLDELKLVIFDASLGDFGDGGQGKADERGGDAVRGDAHLHCKYPFESRSVAWDGTGNRRVPQGSAAKPGVFTPRGPTSAEVARRRLFETGLRLIVHRRQPACQFRQLMHSFEIYRFS